MAQRYRQESADAVKFRRFVTARIENPLAGSDVIQFQEEDVVSIGGANIRTAVMDHGPAGLTSYLDDGKSFQLRDPATFDIRRDAKGAPLTMTKADLLAAIWSLYMQEAEARDAGVEAQIRAQEEAQAKANAA